jgi:hypothetical protein
MRRHEVPQPFPETQPLPTTVPVVGTVIVPVVLVLVVVVVPVVVVVLVMGVHPDMVPAKWGRCAMVAACTSRRFTPTR